MVEARRLVSVHEAGHAAAVLLAECTFDGAEIWPNGNRWEGHTLWKRRDLAFDAFVSFAGPWAEARALAESQVIPSELLVERLTRYPSDRSLAAGHLSQFHAWSQRLEHAWPVIQQYALLIDETSTLTASFAVPVFNALPKENCRALTAV